MMRGVLNLLFIATICKHCGNELNRSADWIHLGPETEDYRCRKCGKVTTTPASKEGKEFIIKEEMGKEKSYYAVPIGGLEKCCEDYNCKAITPLYFGRSIHHSPILWDGKICKSCGALCCSCEWLKLLQFSEE